MIYQINTNGSGFKVLYSFRTDTGSEPHGFVTVVGHDLYGMTDLGGRQSRNGVPVRPSQP